MNKILAAALALSAGSKTSSCCTGTVKITRSYAVARVATCKDWGKRVGESPIDYLTRWRMLVAAERLLSSRDTIAVIAPSLDYDPDRAFSTAFKRVMGCAPRDDVHKKARGI